MSLERIIVFLLAENCLLREALVRVLRKKDDLVVAGAIPFSPSALKKISAANPDVALFDSASIVLTGPCLVSRMRQAGEKPKAVMVGIRLGLSNKEIGNRLNLSEQTVKNHMHLTREAWRKRSFRCSRALSFNRVRDWQP